MATIVQRLRKTPHPRSRLTQTSGGVTSLSTAPQVRAARTLATLPVSHRFLFAHAQQSTIAEGPEEFLWNRFVFAPMTGPARSRLFATCHGRKFRSRRR